jgi:hypothetical protein
VKICVAKAWGIFFAAAGGLGSSRLETYKETDKNILWNVEI